MGLVNNEGGNRDRDIGENGARAEVFTGEESRTGEERERKESTHSRRDAKEAEQENDGKRIICLIQRACVECTQIRFNTPRKQVYDGTQV